MPNCSTILDSKSVITLGHSPRLPLIRALSELADRLEPHDHIVSTAVGMHPCSHGVRWEGVYPGWCRTGGYQEGYYTGYPAEASFEAYLMEYGD